MASGSDIGSIGADDQSHFASAVYDHQECASNATAGRLISATSDDRHACSCVNGTASMNPNLISDTTDKADPFENVHITEKTLCADGVTESTVLHSFNSKTEIFGNISADVSHKVTEVRRKRKRKKCAAGLGKDSGTGKSSEIFRKGNYLGYYGYRNSDGSEDQRLALLPHEFFVDKDILDIGCNAGAMTITIAQKFTPRRITGIDVDARLICAAKQRLRGFVMKDLNCNLPGSHKSKCGPEVKDIVPSADMDRFPHNIHFQMSDYVLESDNDLAKQREEYDVILALSVTKWIHFNHGDDGLKRAFRRMYLQLRPEGRLFLEAQPWQSYRRKRKLTDDIFKVYQTISFRPEQFNDYLLSPEVGFESCHLLGTPCHKSKGFQRSVYVFTKKSDGPERVMPSSSEFPIDDAGIRPVTDMSPAVSGKEFTCSDEH